MLKSMDVRGFKSLRGTGPIKNDASLKHCVDDLRAALEELA